MTRGQVCLRPHTPAPNPPPITSQVEAVGARRVRQQFGEPPHWGPGGFAMQPRIQAEAFAVCLGGG